MTQLPEWMTLTCGTCGAERQVKYRRYGVRRNQNCHACAGRKNNPARWATTHGGHKTKLYQAWCGMKNRCYTTSSVSYDRYGGRGIEVCEDWLDFSVFREWATTHGYAEGMELHRKHNDGNYCPQNCEWLTKREHRYKSIHFKVTQLDVAVIKRMLVDGFRAFEIAKEYKINPDIVSNIRCGRAWKSVEAA